jgi:hypothetical protein
LIFYEKLITGIVEECKPGMVFDLNGCVEQKSDCNGEPLPEETHDSNSKLTVNPTVDLNEICAGRDLSFVPHPTECTLFIICQRGNGEIRTCPIRTPIFHPTRLNCVDGNFKKDPFFLKVLTIFCN